MPNSSWICLRTLEKKVFPKRYLSKAQNDQKSPKKQNQVIFKPSETRSKTQTPRLAGPPLLPSVPLAPGKPRGLAIPQKVGAAAVGYLDFTQTTVFFFF